VRHLSAIEKVRLGLVFHLNLLAIVLSEGNVQGDRRGDEE